MIFIAFDLETTGTVAGVDSIVEIGAVKFSHGHVESYFSTLIDPGIPIPPGATRVNGITNEMVAGQLKIENVLDSFADFCESHPLVAHNAPFDSQFLIADIKRFETRAPRGVVLDTLPMARKIYPGLLNYKLGTLVQHLGIPAGSFHRAQEDASYCGQLLHKMMMKITPMGAVPIENLVALTGKPEMRFPQIQRQPKQLDLLSLF